MRHPDNAAPAKENAAEAIRRGECAVWALPQDETCARAARVRVSETLRALGLPDDLVHDAATMVSELATNVFRHTLEQEEPGRSSGPATSELQIYRRGPRPEIVLRVVDSAPWKGPGIGESLRPAACSESGRGLEVVDALTREHGGTWGVHRTRSRLGGVPAPGKAVYFAVPVPCGTVTGEWAVPGRDSLQISRELESALVARGLGPIHRRDGWDMSLLSVRAGITVWVRGTTISVTSPSAGSPSVASAPSGVVRYPACDLVEVVETIVRQNEDLDARRP